MLFAPSISQPEASATENNSGVSTYAATPTVGISLPTSIDFDDVLPTPSGATTTATADLTITTSDSAGYSLYLYSSDGDNSLRPKISANTSSITATAGDVGLTLSSLKPNTWGYNLGTEAPTDSTTYSAVPTDNSAPIQTKDTSDTNSANDTYTLSFGAKVDTTIPSGTYTGALTIAVVAEAKAISNLTELTYMQDMTPEICANSNENDTTRLVDSRDGKYYWVAKLKDGNCWMTQNLALDLSVDAPLTPEDSDVTSPWMPGYDTQTDALVGVDDYNATVSWNLGEYVPASPMNGYCSGLYLSSPKSCEGFTDVSAMSPMTELSSNNDIISGDSYDAHYLIGNYYQWSAATVGAGDSLASGNASSSICPKGWHLPTSNNAGLGSFEYLINVYGYTTSDSLVSSPVYFVDAGYVQVSISSNEPQTRAPEPFGFVSFPTGSYWSSTAYSSTDYAYSLFFNSGYVDPSNYNGRYHGFSVRCLADGNITTGGGDSADNN